MEIGAFQLPRTPRADTRVIIHEDEHVRAWAPALTPAELSDCCARLVAARATLQTLPLDRIIAAIDAAARRLRSRAGAERDIALHALRHITGYSAAMAERTLDRICDDWSAPTLRELVDVELGGAAAIESFLPRAGARVRAVAPPLALHVFSGNVPGVSITSVVRSLLVRSAVIGKTAAQEPVLAPLFARLLADQDAAIGACVAITYWPGGDAEREAAVLQHATQVVHYGSSEAIASLRARAPAHVSFLEHGPRISFAIVNAAADEATLRRAADELALAVALFDQQGCVSPQLAYVIGGTDRARGFAAAVAAALDRLAAELPRGRIDAAEAAAIHGLRGSAEFADIGGADVQMWSGAELSHTVLFRAEPTFEGTCLNRTLLVQPADSEELPLAQAAPYGPYLQTVGVAGFTTADRDRLAMRLADLGVSRVTSLVAMPWPPAAWHHDGRGPLRELVRWVDVED